MEAMELQNLHHRSSMHALPCANASKATHKNIYTQTHWRAHMVRALIEEELYTLAFFFFFLPFFASHSEFALCTNPARHREQLRSSRSAFCFLCYDLNSSSSSMGSELLGVTCTELAIACTYQEPAMRLHVMPDGQHIVHQLHFHFVRLFEMHFLDGHKQRMQVLSCDC